MRCPKSCTLVCIGGSKEEQIVQIMDLVLYSRSVKCPGYHVGYCWGADLSPNGSARSMYVLPIHEIAMIFWVNWHHAICILWSILTSSVLRPSTPQHHLQMHRKGTTGHEECRHWHYDSVGMIDPLSCATDRPDEIWVPVQLGWYGLVSTMASL